MTEDEYGFNPSAYCTPASGTKSSNIGEYENGGVGAATAACNANPSCRGFTMRKSKTQYILKSTLSGTYSASGYSCYVKPRRYAATAGAVLFGGGHAVSALGVATQTLPLIWLGSAPRVALVAPGVCC